MKKPIKITVIAIKRGLRLRGIHLTIALMKKIMKIKKDYSLKMLIEQTSLKISR